MKRNNQVSGCWLLATVVIISGTMSLDAQAADSYLQALKVEADKVDPEGGKDSKSSEPAYPSKGLPPQTVNPAETIKSGLKKDSFEQQLQDNYYGSYLFYSTLSKNQRIKVYEEYKQKNDIKSIRQSIMAKLKR